MQVFTDDQLAAWAAAVPDIDKTVAPITDSMKEAVGILEEEFGPVELTLQGSYARSTAIPAATLTSCCTAATPARPGRRLGAIQRNGATRNFRQDAEDALRGWNGAAEMPRRSIWTSIDGVEVHVLPVLPYTSDS